VDDRGVSEAGNGERRAGGAGGVAGAGGGGGAGLLEAERAFAERFRREQPALWWGTLVGPVALTVAWAVLAGLTRGVDVLLSGLLASGAALLGFGRFVILMGGDQRVPAEDGPVPGWQSYLAGLSAGELFVVVTWVDLAVVCLIIFHASALYRIPRLGPAMLALQESGRFLLERHPWLQRFAWAGLVVLVIFPLAATGAVGGAIFGRLVGLSRWATLSGLVVGSVVGNGLMVVLGRAIKSVPFLDPDNPLNLLGGVLLVGVVVFLLNRRFRRLKAEWARTGGAGGAAAERA
jgi:uncharacterized membrane protein